MEELPPGFRFYPTEEELLGFYLKHKLEWKLQDLNRNIDRIIPVVDIYNYDPADLPKISEALSYQKHPEQWIFFVANERRGGRPSRQTAYGYWKATGSAGLVYANNKPIGGKRTMVFYRGRAPQGTKTDWRMNEYAVLEPHHHHHASSSLSASGPAASSSSNAAVVVPDPAEGKYEYSICRVYKKSSQLRSFDRRPILESRRPPVPTMPEINLQSNDDSINPSELFMNSQPLDQNPRFDQTVENASLPRELQHHHHHHHHHNFHDHSSSSSPPSSPSFWDFHLDYLFKDL